MCESGSSAHTRLQDDEEQAAPVKTKWAGLVIGVKTN